jgi:sugar lactone lactonase YvrE
MSAADLEIIAEGDALGEAPFWDEKHQRLIWSDVYASTVYAYDPAKREKSVVRSGDMVFGLVPHHDGGFVITGATGMQYAREGEAARRIVNEFNGDALFLNDCIADSQGRVYAGTVYWGPNGLVKRGHLFLINTDGSARIVDSGMAMSNGLGFSPDNKTLYFTDSYDHVIYAYDVDPTTGSVSNRRTFVKVDRNDGLPDGMTVDAEGNVWSALWFGSKVACYDPDGKLKTTVELPIRQVASVMFGGKDLDELYITSSSVPFKSVEMAPEGYDFDVKNVGGAVYRTRPGVRGRLENRANIRVPA